MAWCHSFCLFFIFYNIHTYIHPITFIHRHSLRPLSISSSFVCSVGEPPCGAEPRIELGPALQQADALPTEPRRTTTIFLPTPHIYNWDNLHFVRHQTLCSISNGTGYLLPTVFFLRFFGFRRYHTYLWYLMYCQVLDRYLLLYFLEFGIWNLDHLVTCGIPSANTSGIPRNSAKFRVVFTAKIPRNSAEFRGIPYVFQKIPYSVGSQKRTSVDTLATLPQFVPIEGPEWFSQISSQWEYLKNRFAFISFGKIKFLPPCFWDLWSCTVAAHA